MTLELRRDGAEDLSARVTLTPDDCPDADLKGATILDYAQMAGRVRTAICSMLEELGFDGAVIVQRTLEEIIREATSPQEREAINSPQDVAGLVTAEMAPLDQEHLRVLLLNTKNQVLNIQEIYVGNVKSSIVRPSEVFRPAVKCNAPSIIVVHNHPSGDPTPSPEDVLITTDLLAAGQLLGIELLDHLVIGHGGRYVSLRAKQLGFTRRGSKRNSEDFLYRKLTSRKPRSSAGKRRSETAIHGTDTIGMTSGA